VSLLGSGRILAPAAAIEDQNVTRDEVLAEYAAIRASVDRVTAASDRAFSKAEGQRAARLIAPTRWKEIFNNEDALQMISDLALHEPGPNGRCAYDRFLAGQAARMSATDLDVARRMGTSRFSIFRTAGPHEVAGVWVEDLMDARRRLWLMDKAAEKTAFKGASLAMRVMDAGRFYVNMFCIPDFPEVAAEMFARDLLFAGSSLTVAAYRLWMTFLMASETPSA
jgi:hypothetical protein